MNKKKKDKMELDKGQGKQHTPSEAVPSGPSAPLSATASVFVPIEEAAVQPEPELDDGWADQPMIGPRLPQPPVGVALQEQSQQQQLQRSPSPRRQSSRSPRRDEENTRSSSTSEPTPPVPPLVPGHIAVLRGLGARPELNGRKVRLVEEESGGRWVVALRGDEKIRVHPDKLAGLHAGFQRSAEAFYAQDGGT